MTPPKPPNNKTWENSRQYIFAELDRMKDWLEKTSEKVNLCREEIAGIKSTITVYAMLGGFIPSAILVVFWLVTKM